MRWEQQVFALFICRAALHLPAMHFSTRKRDRVGTARCDAVPRPARKPKRESSAYHHRIWSRGGREEITEITCRRTRATRASWCASPSPQRCAAHFFFHGFFLPSLKVEPSSIARFLAIVSRTSPALPRYDLIGASTSPPHGSSRRIFRLSVSHVFASARLCVPFHATTDYDDENRISAGKSSPSSCTRSPCCCSQR